VARLLPLFPLNVVLFPRTPLPLHIFEDRYKEMIDDVLREESEFGVVLAGEKGICSSGCTAIVEKVLERYPDGRLDLLSIGRRRFEIRSLDDEKSYLRGTVDFFDDEEFEPVPPDLKQRVLEDYEELRAYGEESAEPQTADAQLSFQLAQIVSDLNFRQTLLVTRSEMQRMRQLAEFLPSFTSRQREMQRMRTLAPRNGHGKWPSNV
jgi:Lon protease-like protein